MDPARATTAGGPEDERPVALLERALAWTGSVLEAVPGVPPDTPTPCADWDLAALLGHMVDSFAAVTEATGGRVGLAPLPHTVPGEPDAATPAEQARRLRRLGCALLGEWVHPHARAVRLGEWPVADTVVAEVGALEVAVHGWDLARTCGVVRTLPEELAAALLPVALRRVQATDREGRFAPPVTGDVGTDPASVLLAYLGRRP